MGMGRGSLSPSDCPKSRARCPYYSPGYVVCCPKTGLEQYDLEIWPLVIERNRTCRYVIFGEVKNS